MFEVIPDAMIYNRFSKNLNKAKEKTLPPYDGEKYLKLAMGDNLKACKLFRDEADVMLNLLNEDMAKMFPQVSFLATTREPQFVPPDKYRVAVGVDMVRLHKPLSDSEIDQAEKKGHPTVCKGGETHLLVPGDTLWDLAKTYYGAGSLYPLIAQANPTRVKNPDQIYAGDTLTIPYKKLLCQQTNPIRDNLVVQPEPIAHCKAKPVAMPGLGGQASAPSIVPFSLKAGPGKITGQLKITGSIKSGSKECIKNTHNLKAVLNPKGLQLVWSETIMGFNVVVASEFPPKIAIKHKLFASESFDISWEISSLTQLKGSVKAKQLIYENNDGFYLKELDIEVDALYTPDKEEPLSLRTDRRKYIIPILAGFGVIGLLSWLSRRPEPYLVYTNWLASQGWIAWDQVPDDHPMQQGLSEI